MNEKKRTLILKGIIISYIGILSLITISSALGYSIQPHWILNLERATLFIGNRQISSYEIYFLYGIFCISAYLATLNQIIKTNNLNFQFTINLITIFDFSIFIFPEIMTLVIVWPIIVISLINPTLNSGFIIMSLISLLTIGIYSFIIRIYVKSQHTTSKAH